VTDTDVKLIERHPPRVSANTFPLGLSWGEFIAMCLTAVVILSWTLSHSDASTILAGFVTLLLTAAVFVLPVNKARERLIHIIPRYVAFTGRIAAGTVDIHFRELEGRHYTHRQLPVDVPLSIHLGEGVWLSSFDWLQRHIGLIVQDGTRLRPWRAAHSIVIQVSGQDSMLLESADYQETLLARWTTMLDTIFKQNLGLSGLQELMSSRPLVQGEGAHWVDDPADGSDAAARYRAVQLAHDAVATERCLWLVLRSGGTFTSWFKARHHGSSRAGVDEHFRGVLDKMNMAARQAKLTLVSIMDADQIADRLRLMVDPSFAPAVGYRETGQSPRSRSTHVAPIGQWEEHHGHVIVNGWYVQTFRVVGWPARIVGPQFLAAALTNHQGGLRVSVTMAPEDPKTSLYINRAGMTNAAGKADRRAAKGTVTTAQDAIVEAQPGNRDVEMAAGHSPLQYVVHLSTVAESEEASRRAGDDLATQCDAIGVDIAACHGFQASAFAYTLPLCRGI
jgi:hypothetical protein